jgi:large subunit ribosomal protein L10
LHLQRQEGDLLSKSAKEAWKTELEGQFQKAGALFTASYSRMTVEELSALRRELRNANAEFKIVKNTLAKKALEDSPLAALSQHMKGQTGVVFAHGDVAAAAKIFTEAAKKFENLKVTGGFMDSSVLSEAAIQQLASLPSREVLIAKILGSLVAPHKGILGVMQGVPRAMVYVLNQIKETKSA